MCKRFMAFPFLPSCPLLLIYRELSIRVSVLLAVGARQANQWRHCVACYTKEQNCVLLLPNIILCQMKIFIELTVAETKNRHNKNDDKS